MLDFFFHDNAKLVPDESDGMQPETRRIFGDLIRDRDAWKVFIGRASTGVQVIMLATLTYLLLGKKVPGLNAAVMSSRLGQLAFVGFNWMAGLGFSGIEAYNVYQDFWESPEQLDSLKQLRDTTFNSATPNMKQETAAVIPDLEKNIHDNQTSAWRWSMHIFGFIAGIQAMSPIFKMARGGVVKLLEMRNPMRYVDRRFATHAARLELEPSLSPYAAAEKMTAEQAYNKGLETYTKVLKGTRGEGDAIILDRAGADLLKRDAEKQLDMWSNQLQLNPKTGLAWEEPVVNAFDLTPKPPGRVLPPGVEEEPVWLNKTFEWLKGRPQWLRRKMQYGQKLEESQSALASKVTFLRNLIERMSKSNPQVTSRDLIELIGNELDPAIRHTPFLMTLLGIKNVNSDVRVLREIREITQAELDILALHEPHVLQTLVSLNRLELPGAAQVEKWEIFSPSHMKRYSEMPQEVRAFFQELQTESMALADQFIAKEFGTFSRNPE